MSTVLIQVGRLLPLVGVTPPCVKLSAVPTIFNSVRNMSLTVGVRDRQMSSVRMMKSTPIWLSAKSGYYSNGHHNHGSSFTPGIIPSRNFSSGGVKCHMMTRPGCMSNKASVDPEPKPSSPAPTNSPSSSSSTTKKRAKRKTTGGRFIGDEVGYEYDTRNTFPVVAYATCEELDLEKLHSGLVDQDLYIPTVLSDDMEDVIHVSAKYKISDEPREIFFFREGAVVFWNMPELECINALKFLKTYEHGSYDVDEVTEELEYMRYCYNEQGPSRLTRGQIVLNVESENKIFEKYAFANGLASSVKLGIWESTLDRFADSIAHITEELKRAENIKLSRKEVLQKTGELFSLRHELNLNSDLLDTPDFYWERERLETLYRKTCNYLSIDRRTKVLNEKLAQCCELLELISTHLTDRHNTRLEWMIIALIAVEVGFEILHVVERYN